MPRVGPRPGAFEIRGDQARCKKCGGWCPWPEGFAKASKPVQAAGGLRRLLQCKGCDNRRRNKHRARNLQAARDRQTRYRTRHRDRARAQSNAYAKTEAGKATRRRYLQTLRGKRKAREAARRRRRRLQEELRKLKTSLPGPVVAPYIEQLRVMALAHVHREQGKYPGLQIVADWTGVDEALMFRILDGKKKSVALDTADRLATHADFTLEEIYDRAAEWALLTGDKWPKGYGKY